MGKPHPLALRERVVAFVGEGNTHQSAAAHFWVSIKFVNDMVKLKCITGSLAPKPQGNGDWSKLGAFDGWARGRLAHQGDLTLDDLTLDDLTLDDLVRELCDQHGMRVARSSVGYWLHRLGLSHKKTLLPSEQMRPDIARARTFWIAGRQPFMRNHLERLAYIELLNPAIHSRAINRDTSLGQQINDILI